MMIKSVKIALFITISIFVLCSCGKDNKQTDSSIQPQQSKELQGGSITPIMGFDTAGFTEIICNQSGTCEFKPNDVSISNSIEWEVYVFKKAFSDSFRLIPQGSYKSRTDVSTTASISVKKGDHLYLYCSENAFTLDSKSKVTTDARIDYIITK